MGAKGELYTPDLKRASQNEVWFRYKLAVSGTPSFNILNTAGVVIKAISGLGSQKPSEYTSRSRAVFWNRRDTGGSLVAAGNYFVEFVVDSDDQDILRFILP
jgi:hypothetical protein